MKHSILSFEQGVEAGIYLLQAGNKTLLSLGQVFELGLKLSTLPSFHAKTLVRFYASHSIDTFQRTCWYGLSPGDKIVKAYKHALISNTSGLI